MDFRLPELGEGITSATVVNIAVKAGDTVTPGQTMLEVETDKAAMPISAPMEGRIDRVHVKQGEQVKVGAVVLNFAGNGVAPAASAPAAQQAPAPAPPQSPAPTPSPSSNGHAAAPTKQELKVPVLGEGIEGGTIVNIAVKAGDTIAKGQLAFEIETDKASMPIEAAMDGKVEEVLVKAGQAVKIGAVLAIVTGSASSPVVAAAIPAPAKSPPSPAPQAETKTETKPAPVPQQPGKPVAAGPATRRLARELGVSLYEIPGSARGGRVTLDDVKSFVRKRIQSPAPAAGGSGTIIPPLPDFAKFGAIERKPFTGMRKAIARNLTLSWNVAPQVTQHDLADITELEAGRKRFVETAAKGQAKVTMTTLVIKAAVAALKAFPNFNASYDPHAGDNGEIILKKYFHIGVAVDTPRGLVVPVIRDADKKTMLDLATEVAALAEKAREGKLTPDEMKGGTFTITNLGGIGGTYFSPILNYPEVAILGLSRSSMQAVVRDGQIEPRLMLPLSLTYDHRVVDGADGARFTSRIAGMLADPSRLMFES